MTPLSSLGVFVALAVAGTAIAAHRGHVPPAKQTHLFETPDGERANPLADVVAGAKMATETGLCHRCGATLGGPYEYCVTCRPNGAVHAD
ncbi:hypothetical protein [Halobellus rubicundus]|uniref:Small CPxCG-related zinc finger protein n=1 Tax=Halobellus rubicundus TaxID=2996466 RepID=A0ABD5MAB0_9EURY